MSDAITTITTLTHKLLEQAGTPLVITQKGTDTLVPFDRAAAADGFLPALLLTAEALWLDLSGTGFALHTQTGEGTALGMKITAIDGDSLLVVLLALMEIVAQWPVRDGVRNLMDLPLIHGLYTDRAASREGAVICG